METHPPRAGTIGWIDLTVPDAAAVSEFYAAVAGWEVSPVSMGAYDDFNMVIPGDGEPVAGICHARGSNADLPPSWLMYITVEDVDASAEICRNLGGQVIAEPRDMGDLGRFSVIRDPAGAVVAVFAYKR